jgi:DNA-binding beta-propeller fold protein YncE
MLDAKKKREPSTEPSGPSSGLKKSLTGDTTMSRKPLVSAILALTLLFPGLARAQDSGPYKILKIQLVGGDGGFDYVTADSDGRNLYVARSGPDGHIGVYNLDTLAQVGDIPGVSAHGGAVDTSTGHGFATSKPVTMFDSRTFAILKKIDVQGNPDGYLNDPYNHHFYILSHAEPNITVLDDKDGSILGTVDIGGAPEQAAADGHGKIYVDIEDKSAIAVIDANTMKVIGKYDVSSKGGGCAGLALDAKNSILFAACRDNKNMIILSATDGHIITDLPIGSGSDGATFNPATMEAFSSQGDGTLTVVKENSPTSFSVEQTVATPARAKTLTLDTKTNQIFSITAEFGPVPAAPAQTATQPPGGPAWMRGPRAPMIPHSFQIIVLGK